LVSEALQELFAVFTFLLRYAWLMILRAA